MFKYLPIDKEVQMLYYKSYDSYNNIDMIKLRICSNCASSACICQNYLDSKCISHKLHFILGLHATVCTVAREITCWKSLSLFKIVCLKPTQCSAMLWWRTQPEDQTQLLIGTYGHCWLVCYFLRYIKLYNYLNIIIWYKYLISDFNFHFPFND